MDLIKIREDGPCIKLPKVSRGEENPSGIRIVVAVLQSTIHHMETRELSELLESYMAAME